MYKKFKSCEKHFGGKRAQAMVEFAIVLPVLLMLLFGIIEASRMIFMYAMVVNASRDAVRYASAYGVGDDGYVKYSDCRQIREIAKRSGFLLNLSMNATSGDIRITYDNGNLPNPTKIVTEVSAGNACDLSTLGEDPQVVGNVDSGDRVTVKVTAQYKPLVPLLPIRPTTFSSTSSRTILGIFKLGS
jgi:Flp pilus assembly protein TadG